MTHLDDSFRNAVRTYLARTGANGRRLGAGALGDPGFVASLMQERRTGLATGERPRGTPHKTAEPAPDASKAHERAAEPAIERDRAPKSLVWRCRRTTCAMTLRTSVAGA